MLGSRTVSPSRKATALAPWPPARPRDFRALVFAINALEPDLVRADIGERAAELAARVRRGEPVESVVVEAFAVAREACRRTLGMRPFDVQLHGALALVSGAVAEMQTGEGKTLAAVPACFVLAAAGHGVHVLTANDYLARRDAAWMGPAYEVLGVRAAAVQQGMTPGARRAAYAADVTYGTATEVGFDFLRDRLAYEPDELVQRRLHAVLVDEIDSILIDEARVPLVVAGGETPADERAYAAAEAVRELEEGVHFTFNPDGRRATLTPDGEAALPDGTAGPDVLTALQARALARRDVEYIVRDGRVEIVDELKGRTDPLRRWPDGFHTAVEAREGLPLTPEGSILGSITLQAMIRLYPVRCGMTATASTSADELRELYGLEVVVVPPNRRCVRRDEPDVIFATMTSKERALVDEIARVHATGRPVLVGTANVAESERLAALLAGAGVRCRVLNARNDAAEAAIVADAGAPGAVTISTNMAGRGTDIRLGGHDESAREEVARLGGLYVIGTNRHDARRIDLQLRGRAGRQGDPGSSRFFVSLEDPLFARHRAADLLGNAERLRVPDDGPCTNWKVRKEVTVAQETVDWLHFQVRRSVDQFGQVVERQRREIDAWRTDVLYGALGSSLLRDVERLRDRFGEADVRRIERLVTVACIDEGWAQHLTEVRELREHLSARVRERQYALEQFRARGAGLFEARLASIRARVVDIAETAPVTDDGLDLESAGIVRPTAKWTYLLSEMPARAERYRDLEIFFDLLRTGFHGYTPQELAASEGHR